MKTPEELENYLRTVDTILVNLRSKALGQDASYHILLPVQGESWPAEEKAAYLTKRCLFALTKADPVVSILPELEESRDWLYTLILFLETRHPPSDHTFSAMKQIIDLEDDTREALFASGPYDLLQSAPPYLLTNFDLAALYLLESSYPFPHSPLFLTQPQLSVFENLLSLASAYVMLNVSKFMLQRGFVRWYGRFPARKTAVFRKMGATLLLLQQTERNLR